MTSPDPEDPYAGGTGGRRDEDRHRRAELPADVDAEFAAIVASWAAADAPRWPGAGGAAGTDDDGPADGERPSGVGLATPPGGAPRVAPPSGPAAPPSTPSPPSTPEPRVDPPRSAPDDVPAARPAPPPGPRDHTPPPDPEDEHYVPPEPPPLPRLGLPSVIGLLLLVAGVVLLAVPDLLGGAVGVGIVPGLLAMTAGLGWLVFGLRRPSERGDGSGPDERGEL